MPIEQELMSVSPAQNDCAGMPGAARFRHALHDVAVLHHDVMGGNLAQRRAQVLERKLGVAHAGVVQDQHVGLGAGRGARRGSATP